MVSFTPITLSGDNLGQRHRYFNSLVRKTIESGGSIQEFDALEEHSLVDRLFKIDLAIKLKNKGYIIRNLKEIDMLYVSRALKATWLLDHHDIINPKYLEDVLFPEMMAPAVSKMKHWLYINLRDPKVCQEFYQFYKENIFEFAIKFLSHCSNDFILKEVPNILTKISTHRLKILSEKCPKVAKIYFDSLSTDEDVIACYLGQEEAYYNSIKCILKSDADVFLDITEKYFNIGSFKRLSSSATDYILRYHKNRFTNKLELYVAYFLHIPTLASLLGVEESREVIMKLAQAKFLQNWFEYKIVEPLVKRISPNKRAELKKQVFVKKDVGECRNEWPYEIPNPPIHSGSDPLVFDDKDFMYVCGRPLLRQKMMKCAYQSYCYEEDCMMPIKSDLDRLFDEYRFIGFDRALYEIGQRLKFVGSADRRRDMFLVLVSKSGGRSDAVSAVLCLAARYSNEPAHIRASVLRSLVKRANVWRLPTDTWKLLLDFGHGLGLDGAAPQVTCREGLHAVTIRQLLAGECNQDIRAAFLREFSTLQEYSLSVAERARICFGLQNMLTAAALDTNPKLAAERLSQLLDVLKIYRVDVETASPMVQAAKGLALRDVEIARPLLERMYDAKIARRELLRVNLEFRRDEAALVNALRHDLPALETKSIVKILTAGASRFDKFFSKLLAYFNDEDGLASKLRIALKDNIYREYSVKLARPLASLNGIDLEDLRAVDEMGTDRMMLAAALRACAHCTRPPIDVVEWGWRKAGVKAVATRVMRCREVERAGFIRALAAERRTVRLALALSMRSKGELLLDTFDLAAKLRPVATLRAALSYFRNHGARADSRVWDIVKPLITDVDLSSRGRLRRLLGNTDWVPSAIKADYCASLYLVFDKISNSSAEYVLRELSKLLPEVREESVEIILHQILENTHTDIMPAIPTPAIFIRYLMLSRNNEDLKRRFENIGERFLERLDTLRCENDVAFQDRLDQILESLKYNGAFLDMKYASCLSVIEKIVFWMQKFLPREEYFKMYVQIHLTMLYFKAVRQSMKQMPEIFNDPKRKLAEGVAAVGFVFGRYIMKEVAELVSTYFESIIDLYTIALVDYLDDYFMYGSSIAKFVGYVIKGIMTEGVGNQRRIAVYILRNRRYGMEESMRKEIEELMINDKAIEYFVHAELFV